ncbi:MAG: sulfate adenylyltransferase subunit CysN [Deltaproteobacteria bacterium]|nr:sulfate adenylyltransferase subunit CysN [Deltaproteobacteria bacterium]
MLFDEEALIRTDIHQFLERNQKKELLRFVTVGSVDDGKSTLIGRLLHDTKGVYDDQLKDATQTSETGEKAIDFARITDGLRAEREQGITIDVAYRYFSTPQRKFIIADTPGHVQYTRNMATGASTANVAIILIDARHGVLTQSRRHAYIASLLGIPHLLVCVNKLDLVDYNETRYKEIEKDFLSLSDQLRFESITCIPVSALMGVNIVEPNAQCLPWYQGNSVLSFLETVKIQKSEQRNDFRFPVQYVLRPNLDYRGYAGQITSGSIRVGDRIEVCSSGKGSIIEAIDTYSGPIEEAYAPLSVTIRLKDELDISRGDLLVRDIHNIEHAQKMEATLVWMSEVPLDPNRSYWIKHCTQYVHANIDALSWKLDMQTLDKHPPKMVMLNDIAGVQMSTHSPISFDPYHKNRSTGSFIMIDFMTNQTVAAGMFSEKIHQTTIHSSKERRLRQKGYSLWLDNLQKANDLERKLNDLGHLPILIHAQDSRYQSIENPVDLCSRLKDAGLIVLLTGCERPQGIADLSQGTCDDILTQLREQDIIF